MIRGLITDYAGIFAYMDKEALHRLMREGPTVSGAYVSLDYSRWLDFLQEVNNTPRIAAMMIKSAVRDSFRKTTAETINLVQSIYFAFSVIVALGVVYNSARIALSERSRDLATLRVIGFSHREVARGGLTVSVLEEGKTRIRNRYVISPPLAGLLQRTPLRAGDRLEAGKTVVAQLETQPAGFLRSPIPRAGRGRSQGGGGGCPFAHS